MTESDFDSRMDRIVEEIENGDRAQGRKWVGILRQELRVEIRRAPGEPSPELCAQLGWASFYAFKGAYLDDAFEQCWAIYTEILEEPNASFPWKNISWLHSMAAEVAGNLRRPVREIVAAARRGIDLNLSKGNPAGAAMTAVFLCDVIEGHRLETGLHREIVQWLTEYGAEAGDTVITGRARDALAWIESPRARSRLQLVGNEEFSAKAEWSQAETEAAAVGVDATAASAVAARPDRGRVKAAKKERKRA